MTGMTRKIDELGRVVLPRELRRSFDINEKDPVEIYVVDEKIMIKKYTAGEPVLGIVRKVDELGRVVLPMEVRKKFDILADDMFEVDIGSNGGIVLKKATIKCTFCSSKLNIFEFMGKHICQGCIKKIAKLKP